MRTRIIRAYRVITASSDVRRKGIKIPVTNNQITITKNLLNT
jgi:hypothetical protein